MQQPKVSIIIPVYNVQAYLPACLDSVLAQTFKDWQAVCINDGSTDDCAEILATYARKDARFQIITQENQGLSMARNNGLKQATGDYIYFLDSDDAMHPQLLEFALKAMEEKNADLFCFEYEKTDGKSYCPKMYKGLKYKTCSRPVFCGFHGRRRITFNVWSKVYKRSLIEDLTFIPRIHFEDFPYTYAVLAKNPKTLLTKQKLYFYTIRTSNISHQPETVQRIKDFRTGLNYVCDLYRQGHLQKELAFVKRTLIPAILKQQHIRCLNAESHKQQEMLMEFVQGLRDLQAKGLLSWRGHQLKRYWQYKKLLSPK